jgi:hypothetical protein
MHGWFRMPSSPHGSTVQPRVPTLEPCTKHAPLNHARIRPGWARDRTVVQALRRVHEGEVTT